MLTIERPEDGFALTLGAAPLLRHAPGSPMLFVGRGTAEIAMHRGNFSFSDRLESREPLRYLEHRGAEMLFRRHPGDDPQLVLRLAATPASVHLDVTYAAPGLNRFWLRIRAQPGEAVWGGGEQMSYFDLRGRLFPLWTSEPGVGRDKTSPIAFQADVEGQAGGDYWTTNYPQPTILSPRLYALHVETTAYAVFDFRDPEFHEFTCWAPPTCIELLAAPSLPALVGQLSERFGRQPALPDWTQRGLVLGLKRGEDHARAHLAEARAAGIPVAALWCEDWAGVRQTSFGTRLFWDWRWSPARYPTLDRLIAELHAEDTRFLAYANPYLCRDGTLFPEAEAAGAFAKDAVGGTALVDFGEFEAGVIDFTSPTVTDWFIARVLRREMLDLGIDGWMADFGEYLPTNVRLRHGDPLLEHNAWPVRWAEANARALAEAGRTGDALYFMRAGYTGVQRYCPLLWAGDQCVDFSRHDGLVTAITGALSSGLLGNAYHHSDIGGYTSLFGLRRTPELFMRWAELTAFTALMRTHEGNRPTDNFQWWEDAGVTAHLARMARIFAALAPYRRTLMGEARAQGLPLMRPCALHFPDDPATHALHAQFLLGPDLLVAPVTAARADSWQPWLPAGAAWRHLWTGRLFAGGAHVNVPAPLGHPPVFVRDHPATPDLAAVLEVVQAC